MRFNEAMNEERRKAEEKAPKKPTGPSTPQKDGPTAEDVDKLRREVHTNNRVRKLLGTGRGNK